MVDMAGGILPIMGTRVMAAMGTAMEAFSAASPSEDSRVLAEEDSLEGVITEHTEPLVSRRCCTIVSAQGGSAS